LILIGQWADDLQFWPGLGELSPVIGIWPSHDRYAHHLYVCTDNGDWAHRPVDSPLLRADIRTPSRPGRPAVAPASVTRQPVRKPRTLTLWPTRSNAMDEILAVVLTRHDDEQRIRDYAETITREVTRWASA
jgi:hypothetical protein